MTSPSVRFADTSPARGRICGIALAYYTIV
ncbi:hypothetical protein J2X45_002571 [Caulobacter sp. BE264]|nr:hypothetical protein [Caulobacter sp. BE264]